MYAARWMCVLLAFTGCGKPAEPPTPPLAPTSAPATSREILVDLARWDAATTADRRAAAEDVARRTPDFALLRLETFSCGGQTHEVAIYRHAKTEMEFVLVPGGTFQMGDSPLHRVTLPTPFLIARTHCTQASYEKITGSNPSNFEGATLPVESVSWKDAKAFCDKTGLELPVETQWEYACRAGTTTAYSFGDSAASLGEYAWYSENADEATHPVGEKKPNAFGLYDMHGDVYDWSGEWPADQPRAVLIPRDPSGATYRVFRGSSWHDSAEYAHSEQQGYGPPNDGSFQIGFRPAKTVPMD